MRFLIRIVILEIPKNINFVHLKKLLGLKVWSFFFFCMKKIAIWSHFCNLNFYAIIVFLIIRALDLHISKQRSFVFSTTFHSFTAGSKSNFGFKFCCNGIQNLKTVYVFWRQAIANFWIKKGFIWKFLKHLNTAMFCWLMSVKLIFFIPFIETLLYKEKIILIRNFKLKKKGFSYKLFYLF